MRDYDGSIGDGDRLGDGYHPGDDPLYDLRTHLTDASLAAGFLRRADADRDDAARRRVHEHLRRAHEALREDVGALVEKVGDREE